MAKSKKTWMPAPQKKSKSQVPDNLRAEVQTKANELVESVLKPKHIQPPPKGHHFNFITDIGTKWVGSSFYFGATYACPGPNAIKPSFEARFARLEYVGGNRFNLAYMRHTGKWIELFAGMTLQQCLDEIQAGGPFEA